MTTESPNSQLCTAARIATDLGLTSRAVRKRMAGVAAQSCVMHGQQVSAWPIEDLPADWRIKLDALARQRGYRDYGHLLTNPQSRWQPEIPLERIEKKFVEEAIRLQEALRLPLDRRIGLSVAELATLGLAEYKRVFGYPVGESKWKALFDRTLQRDRGAGDWLRVEIYLDEAALIQPAIAKGDLRRRHLHLPLEEWIQNLDNKTDPTAEDREHLFHAAFAHFRSLAIEQSDASEQRSIKQSLVSFLFAAVPALAKSPKALRKQFDRGLRKWQESGYSHAALQDMRRLKSGNFRTPDFSVDHEKIRDLAIVHGGSESLAHRQLRKRGELSKEFTDYYQFDLRKNKSYLPQSVRQSITPHVDMCGPIYRGPWQARMAGPSIPRDWTDVLPGDFYSGDDVTWNHVVYDPEDLDDKGRPWIGRGECLLFVDWRTGYPLHFVFIKGKYTGRHIRSGLLRIHDDIGLARKGLRFEMGVWASRWTPGERHLHWLHWRETETGFKAPELGFEFDVRHATTPRAKPIEGLFKILQERMRSERGFVGFSEREEDMERLQDYLGRCRRGTEDPSRKLWTVKQWVQRVKEILEEFAHEPQNGKMLPGVSPAEMWEDAVAKQPLRKLPDECRFLLATHKQIRPVTQEGIRIHGIKDFVYCNEETGKRIGERVLAFYNVDCPELLTVSDMKRQNYFTVRGISLKATNAESEDKARVFSQIGAHLAPARAIYASIQHRVVSTITRDDQYDDSERELGGFHNAAIEEHKAAQSVTARKLTEIKKAAAVALVTVPSEIRNPDRVLAGIQKEKEIRERLARKSRSKAADSPPSP